MSLSNLITLQITLNDGVEEVIFAPDDASVDLESILLITGTSEAKEPIHFTTISLIDKGIDGLENNEIASVTTEDIPEGVTFTKYVRKRINLRRIYITGHTLVLKKVDNLSAVNLGKCILLLKIRNR